MGITKGPLFFGINYKAVADITDIVKGKKLALEAYGFLHELVAGHFRSVMREPRAYRITSTQAARWMPPPWIAL